MMLPNPEINFRRAHLGLFSAIATLIIFTLFASLTFADSKRQLSKIELNPFTLKSNQNVIGSISISVNPGTYSRLVDEPRLVTMAVPISKTETVSLELKRFEVLTTDARFYIGTASGNKEVSAPEVIFYRGKVAGSVNSHAYLSFSSNDECTGYITLNGETFHIAHRPGQDIATISNYVGEAELPPLAEFCKVEDAGAAFFKSPAEDSGPADSPAGMRVTVMALDADQAFFNIFGDLIAAETYLLQMLGAVSDIYQRDINMKLMASFVRIWSTGGEPYDQNSIFQFRTYWNNNEDTTGLDLIHLITGRRDLSFGGIAYLSSYCTEFRYSISGYINGTFPTPVGPPNNGNWDVTVMAHELGHNFGSWHTHDSIQYIPIIDSCAYNFASRSTILSYCHIHPGYTANIDMRYHARVQQVIESDIVSGSACFWFDCNDNGIDDSIDIANFTSADVNANEIPDECEDCNGNGIFDSDDILGASFDVNGNGIPDECELDCNGNGVPDEFEANFLNDVNGNNILDICEPDCNNNSIPDHIEISTGAVDDFDRNTVPDRCQDCNRNSVPDWIDLDREFNLYVADQAGGIREYHSKSGVPIQTLASGLSFTDVAVGPDRMIYGIADESKIVKIDPGNNTFTDVWMALAGVLNSLTFGPAGNIYVTDKDQDLVLKIDGATGDSLGVFVSAGLGGIIQPGALTFGPNGNLFVAGKLSNSVVEYSGIDGSLVGLFVTSGDGGLEWPLGLVFKPDGNLLVTSSVTSQVLEFDGVSGAFIGIYNDENPPEGPWGITIGPDGNVFVVRTQDQFYQIIEMFVETGRYYRSFVRRDFDLLNPSGLAFMPQSSNDCDGNFVIDECEGPASLCCCIGDRGDVNGDGDDANVLDLTSLVDFIFRGSGDPGPCLIESDCNGDDSEAPNILDLTFLVDFIFRGGAAPQECPIPG